MSLRLWLYTVLTSSPLLFEIYESRVYQGGSLTSAQTIKPYIIYRFGNDTDEGLGEFSEDQELPHRGFFQVYVHDDPGDYDRIDSTLTTIKDVFRQREFYAGTNIVGIRYLETSQDLNDVVLGTIFRYSRYQLALV